MDGRAFLVVAQELFQGATEAHWRSAAGRAYYALLLEAREALARWGFIPSRRDPIHTFVRLRLTYARDPDLKKIGTDLDRLVQLRNEADYQLTSPGSFATPQRTQDAIADASACLVLLDQIDQDPPRRATAIAAIRAAWP